VTQEEAVQSITEKLSVCKPMLEIDGAIHFYIEKLVVDMLDYCHRTDFPNALVYTAVDAIVKRIDDEADAAGGAPVKSLTMDDTSFTFAVSDEDNTQLISDAYFKSLYPKLNLYRKVRH
jgi:hypothetical protein